MLTYIHSHQKNQPEQRFRKLLKMWKSGADKVPPTGQEEEEE